MALQVWMPLDGSLRNLGLRDVEATNNGATVTTTGKIGSCYTGTTASQTIVATLPGLSDMLANGKKYSFACWVKPNTAAESANGWVVKLGTNTCGLWWGYNTPRLVWNENNNGKRCANGDTTSWHHIAVVIDKTNPTNTTEYNYVDGVPTSGYESQTWDGTAYSEPVNDTITIYPYYALLNDVRIYDHCLSPKEVKELSKGLIGHWPLNDMVGGENLLSVTPRTHTSTAYNAYQFNLSENLVAGQTYTIQLWDVDVSHASKSANDLGVDVYWGGGSVRLYWWHGTNYFTDGHANHLQATFTVTEANASGSGATNAWLNIYNSVGYVAADMSMTIGKWKLEKGSTATPWTPAPSDALYSEMGLDDGIVYDTSGYGRNGYFGNSVFTTHDAVSDTPRYLVGTHLNSSNLNTYTDSSTADYIKIPFTLTSPDAFTVAVWANIKNSYNSSGHGLFASTKDGTGAGTDYQKTLFNHRDNTVDVNSSDEASHIRPPMQITFSTWTHYAVTCDGLTAKTYKNGVLQGSASFSSKTTLGSMVNFYIGLSLAGGVWRKILGDYSDFRIYSTALSEADVKELYEVSSSIDNKGNMYAYEFVEG